MEISLDREPVTEDDEAILAALADADTIPLLPAVAHLTGDLSLLRRELRPDPARMLEPTCGLGEEEVATARRLAAAALGRFRDAGSVAAPAPGDDGLRELLAFLAGEDALGDYTEMLEEELALDGADPRAPGWRADELGAPPGVAVAIIGAGMSGLLMAHRLAQAGIGFVIFEKNAEVGGTWFENTYPGCRVDVPNHLYSYSFAQTSRWPGFYSPQGVLLDYFSTCADDLDLRRHVRFGTEVLSARFDDASGSWHLSVRGPDGAAETLEFAAVVSAVGQLNRPRLPDIAGRDRFAGPSFHSAAWDHGVDLAGRRVAVVGTGASAEQFIPVIAPTVARLVVFQRTPPWLIPAPDYCEDLPDGLRWLLRKVPGYARWDRLWWFWRTHEAFLPMSRVDPDYEGGPGAVSEANEMVREFFTEYLRSLVEDPELFDKVLPQYPPFAKRVLRDDGAWARSLARDNVELVTDPITEITGHGVRTAEGVEHEVDVVIYATGFQASRFLTPMAVTGRGGVDLHESWSGDARAYLGIAVPGFPNFFLLYGPNTNIVANGSIIFFSECEVRYVMGCLRLLLEGGHRTIECRGEVCDDFCERVDAENAMMVWGHGDVTSWYRSESGRVTQNWPFSMLEYWRATRAPDPADYSLA